MREIAAKHGAKERPNFILKKLFITIFKFPIRREFFISGARA